MRAINGLSVRESALSLFSVNGKSHNSVGLAGSLLALLAFLTLPCGRPRRLAMARRIHFSVQSSAAMPATIDAMRYRWGLPLTTILVACHDWLIRSIAGDFLSHQPLSFEHFSFLWGAPLGRTGATSPLCCLYETNIAYSK
jgi:hypothetical protein